MCYIYAASLHCDECGQAIVKKLLDDWRQKYQGKDGIVDCRSCKHRWTPTPEEFANASHHHGWFVCPECGDRRAAFDDYSFDSDDFPKYAGEDGGESDTPQNCDSCGRPLENPLTSDGVDYVLEKIREEIEKAVTNGRATTWDRVMPAEGTAEESHKYLHGSRHIEIVRGWATQLSNYNLDKDEKTIVDLFLELSSEVTKQRKAI